MEIEVEATPEDAMRGDDRKQDAKTGFFRSLSMAAILSKSTVLEAVCVSRRVTRNKLRKPNTNEGG